MRVAFLHLEEGTASDKMRVGRREVLLSQLVTLPLLLLASIDIQLTEALRFSSLALPALVQLRSNFWLACQFELEPSELLYSVKWYKNNEEFYRLLVDAAPSSQATLAATNSGQQQQQQQYFAQAGVNVLMSGSNATHVRLLNASLDTEAAYACEISTQNLSTIRYEREIRLYALPRHAQPAIIGFKRAYSLNDKVDLICSSNFSRPRPALAWFINGRQVAPGEHFQLERRPRWSLESPGLYALNLTLRFRLTAELLAKFASASVSVAASSGPSRPLGLRLECRLRLAEVSEVAYNELAWPPPPQPPPQLPPARRKWRRMAARRPPIRLAKSALNRVRQSRAPAGARDLWLALAGARRSQSQSCRAPGDGGAAPLWPDDPLVVASPLEPQLLNCTTAGALAQQQPPPLPAGDDERPEDSEGLEDLEDSQDDDATDGSLAAAVTATTTVEEQEDAAYCADLGARRRRLISGKHQEQPAAANQRPSLAGGRGRPTTTTTTGGHSAAASLGRHQVAYLSLPAGQLNRLREEAAAADSADGRQPDDQQQHWLSAPPLLEWFINNQEAPRASASYDPELPLVASAMEAPWAAGSVGRSPKEPAALLPPSIDYAEYFANFLGRPIHQHLVLNLSQLHQKPSGKLELRCSSTQAQVLAADSSSVSLVLVEFQEQTSTGSRQRQPNHATGQRGQKMAQPGGASGGKTARSGGQPGTRLKLLSALASLAISLPLLLL